MFTNLRSLLGLDEEFQLWLIKNYAALKDTVWDEIDTAWDGTSTNPRKLHVKCFFLHSTVDDWSEDKLARLNL